MNEKQQVKDLLQKLESSQYADIRNAYYEAVGGLTVLAEALEAADASLGNTPDPLLKEHLLACEASDIMDKSLLGALL